MRLTLGIDEAGRGPVLGPMVMAAVCLSTKAAQVLTRAGLRDSKVYGASDKARETRRELAALVQEVAVHVDVHVIEVMDIDRRVRCNELNVLEREVAEMFIARSPQVDCIVADGKTLFRPLAQRYPHLMAWDQAESRHASVAAASVVAKDRRDRIFEGIRERYRPTFGDIRGGGYVNEATRQFLRAYASLYRDLPPEARRSWPHEYLHDILGTDFDPFANLAPFGDSPPRGQLGLFQAPPVTVKK